MTENLEQTENTTPDQVAEQPSADLTINDLSAIKTIMDIAISRGAFKGNEMVAIGQAYTKLENFLNVITEQAKAQADQTGAQ